jgi:hypothetical protein
MSELRRWLGAEFKRQRWTYEEGARVVGLSKSQAHRLLTDPDFVAGLEVYTHISNWSGLPLYEVMERDGVPLGVPRSVSEQGERIAALVEAKPYLAPLLDQLPHFQPKDVHAVLGLLEHLLKMGVG